MSDRDSKIVKAPFVAMSDIRKEIQTIDPNDPKILKNAVDIPGAAEGEDEGVFEEVVFETEENNETEAISDPVIDGSHTISEEEAREEIEQMLEAARLDAETLREEARQQGYEAGYGEGQRASQQILEQKMAELDSTGRGLAQELADEKDAFMDEVQPRIAYVIRDLVNRMVGVYEDDPSLILFLVRLAFEEIHTYGSIMIKVSDDDFDYVSEHKDELTYGLSEKVKVEILKDTSMKKNQCYVETEMGNVDCSLDLRLDSLSRELKLIGDSLK